MLYFSRWEEGRKEWRTGVDEKQNKRRLTNTYESTADGAEVEQAGGGVGRRNVSRDISDNQSDWMFRRMRKEKYTGFSKCWMDSSYCYQGGLRGTKIQRELLHFQILSPLEMDGGERDLDLNTFHATRAFLVTRKDWRGRWWWWFVEIFERTALKIDFLKIPFRTKMIFLFLHTYNQSMIQDIIDIK